VSVLRHIEGHIDERRAEAREHLAQHLEEMARRLRGSEVEPVGVAAVVLLSDGTRDFELCAGEGLDSLALSASLHDLGRGLSEGT
jgi:hypothetical protein